MAHSGSVIDPAVLVASASWRAQPLAQPGARRRTFSPPGSVCLGAGAPVLDALLHDVPDGAAAPRAPPPRCARRSSLASITSAMEQPVSRQRCEQLGAGAERVRQRRWRPRRSGPPRRPPRRRRSRRRPSSRSGSRSERPAVVERLERHPVGVRRQRTCGGAAPGRRRGRRRSGGCRPARRLPVLLGPRSTRATACVGVDRLGVLALEPEQHRPVGAVPVAGGAERAEQLRLHPGDALEQPAAPPARRRTAARRASGRRCARTTGRSRSENRSRAESAIRRTPASRPAASAPRGSAKDARGDARARSPRPCATGSTGRGAQQGGDGGADREDPWVQVEPAALVQDRAGGGPGQLERGPVGGDVDHLPGPARPAPRPARRRTRRWRARRTRPRRARRRGTRPGPSHSDGQPVASPRSPRRPGRAGRRRGAASRASPPGVPARRAGRPG